MRYTSIPSATASVASVATVSDDISDELLPTPQTINNVGTPVKPSALWIDTGMAETAAEVFTPDCQRAQLVAAYPELNAVCERLQFRWDKSVQEWCGEPGWVLLEFARAAKPPPPAPDLDWSFATIPELIADIIATHHRPLRHELRRLSLIVKQFCRRHAEFRHLNFDHAYTLFADDLLGHLDHEESVVFPVSIAIEGADPRQPQPESTKHNVTSAIRFMSLGHDGASYSMHHLMAIHDLMAANNIDPDLNLIREGLTAMASDLVMHKMKENDILLPAVLFAEEQLHARHTTSATFQAPTAGRAGGYAS